MDLSGALEMLKGMLEGEEGQQQIQNILGMLGNTAGPDTSFGQATGGIAPEDFEMMMKMQKVMAAMNQRKDNRQARLLAALRPFLGPRRREKVDSAMKLLQFSGVFEIMREVQGE